MLTCHGLHSLTVAQILDTTPTGSLVGVVIYFGRFFGLFSTHNRLFSTVHLSHQGHVVTLAMMISGIVLSRKAQLAIMSEEVPGAVKDQSIEMRSEVNVR